MRYDISLNIKIPNDIVFNGKKIGGILTESKIFHNTVEYLIIGIGIDTNQTEFVDELKEIATSIKNEFHIHIDNDKVIKEIAEYIENIIKIKNSKM